MIGVSHKFTIQSVWDFDDHKGWDVVFGARQEGCISWYRADHENAKDDEGEGFYWTGYVPHDDLRGGKFDTLEACADDMWEKLMTTGGKKW